jgi:hypothetical protein
MQDLYSGMVNLTFIHRAVGHSIVVVSVAEDQELSKALFGSSHMHAVIVAINDIAEDEFSAPQIMDRTGLAASSVHTLIVRLVRAGLIIKSGALPGERTMLYRRQEVSALDALAKLGSAAG